MPFFLHPPLHDFPDRAHRQLLENPQNLRELLGAAAPRVAAGLLFDEAKLLTREQRHPDWRRSEVDLFFQIPYREGPEEQVRPALVYVLVEHQSQPDPAMPLRTLLAAVLHWDRQWHGWLRRRQKGRVTPLRLGPVVPVVFHTGPAPWHLARGLTELFDVPESLRNLVPTWQPIFYDLAAQDPEALRGAGGAWLRTMTVVRVERDSAEAFASTLEAVAHSLEPLAKHDRMRWHDFMYFLISWGRQRRSPDEWDHLVELVQESHTSAALQGEIQTMSQTVYQTWEEWAKTHYTDLGREEGALRAYRETLRTQVQERFGILSEAVAQRIDACTDPGRLRAALRQVVRAASPEELTL